jgi:hypothetical protein
VYSLNNGTEQVIFGGNADCNDVAWKFGSDNNIAIKGCNSCTIPTWDGPSNPGNNPFDGRFLVAGKVFGLEFLATFLLVFTVFATAVDPRGAAGNAAPFAIGGSLWAAAKGLAGLTGAALNPARTICPAIVFKCWRAISSAEANAPGYLGDGTGDPGYDTRQWMYIVAQLVAGAFAGLLYMNVFLSRPDDGNPGPTQVFQFVARDGVKVRAAMRNPGEVVITETISSDGKTEAISVTMGDETETIQAESALVQV